MCAGQTRSIFLVSLLWPLLTSCISSEQMAVDRAMQEYSCPKSKIKVRFLNTVNMDYDAFDVYQVRACGQIATYLCSDNSGCRKESDDRRER